MSTETWCYFASAGTKARLKRPEVLLLELFCKKLLAIPIVNDVLAQMQHRDADGQLKVEKM